MVWLQDQMIPEVMFYNVVERFGVKGRLDVELLRRCIDEVTKRHEILRTIYPIVAGWPVQRVEPPHPCSLRVFDLRKCPTARSRTRSAALDRGQRQNALRSRARRGLTSAALAARRRGITFSRLSSITSRSMAGRCGCSFTRSLPSTRHFWKVGPRNYIHLTVQYVDFARWQRRWMTGDVLARHRDYWRDKLGRTRRF